MLKLTLIQLHIMLIYRTSAQSVLEVLPSENFFNLTIEDDGRIGAKIRGGDYYGEGDPYHTVYRNFIGINPNTGNLVVSYGVAEWDVDDNSRVMTVAIPSGATVTTAPRNATFPQPHWYNDNHIIWYDQKQKAFVMIYQEGCYSCLENMGYGDWLYQHTLDALGQALYKTVSYDDGLSWQGKIKILGDLSNAHVNYQIVPGFEIDDEGYATEVMIPVHHLDESDVHGNYQMLWRTNRAIDPQDGSWRYVNMTDLDQQWNFLGHIQATVVRPYGDTNLVAFLRDRNGQWIHRTISADDGQTWSAQIATTLPNPDLMIQAIALHNGKIMLFHNPMQSFGAFPSSTRDDNSHMLAVSISENEGLSWSYQRILEYYYDGMSLYPTALQDPTCDNIYLAWSVKTNNYGTGLGCGVFEYASDNYLDCRNKSVMMEFIRFTVIHETWVFDNHNWQLDYDGCVWQIAETLQDQIREVKYSRAVAVEESRFSTTTIGNFSSYYTLALILVLSGLLLCSVGIFKYKKIPSNKGMKELSIAPL